MSAAWNSGSSTVSREEAIAKTQAMANEQGIRGAFKVFYDGNIIANPSDLPEHVDMTKVKVSNVLDQA